MNIDWQTIVWRQYGAALEMLEDALQACPAELWRARLWEDPSDRPEYCEFWYRIYHTLFWADLFLHGQIEGFAPPPPFQINPAEFSPRLPDQPYTRAELQTYLDDCRRRLRATLQSLTGEEAQRLCRFEWVEASFLEMQFYSMRHVQEHAAQLSMLLGQRGLPAPDWVPQAEAGAA